MKAMVTGKATGEQRRWNFGDSRERFLTLDEFLQKEADGTNSGNVLGLFVLLLCFRLRLVPPQLVDLRFTGKEPWLKGISKLTWQTFFRVCTEEVDDLSMRAVKLVIEYCTLSTSQTALENYE